MNENNRQDKATSKYSDLSNIKLKERIEELLPVIQPFSSADHTKYLDFFQAGLEYEIRLVEKDEREQKITLFDGEIISTDTVTTLRFKTDEILMLMVDSPIQIQFSDNTKLEATYIGQDPVNMTVNLTVEGVVPDHLLERVTILSSSSALLKRLNRRFLEWEKGELERAANLSPVLFNGSFNSKPVTSKYLLPDRIALNTQQKDSLARTVDDGITLLWGPPGTGKTTVLSLSIVNALEQGKRVLLSSNTNKAIDHALNKVVDHIEKNSGLFPNAYRQLSEDQLLRFREIRTDDVYDRLNDKVSLKGIANRKAGGIHEQIEAIKERLREIEAKLRESGLVIKEFQDLKWNLENLDSMKKKLDERKQQLAEKKTLQQDLYTNLTSLTERLGVLEQEVSALKNDEKKYFPLKEAYDVLSGASELRQLLEKNKQADATILKLQEQKETLERVLKSEKPQLIDLENKLKQLNDRQLAVTRSLEIHEEIVSLIKESNEIDSSINKLNGHIAQLQRELQGITDNISKTQSELEEINRSAFSRLRNRSAIRDLETTLNDYVGRKEQVTVSINELMETLRRNQGNATTRKSVINGLLIANREKIRELVGQEYSTELIKNVSSKLPQLKTDIEETSDKKTKTKTRLQQVEDSLPHLNDLLASKQDESQRTSAEADDLKRKFGVALTFIRGQHAPTDVTQGMMLVNEKLAYIEANRNKIQQYSTLHRERVTLFDNLKNTDDFIRNCKTQISEDERKIAEREISLQEARRKYPRLSLAFLESRIDEERQKVQGLQVERTGHNDEIRELELKLSIIEKTVLEEARLVVTTLTLASISTEMLKEKFDCVYVDEMSMCMTPQIYMVAASASRTVVISGDHAQLPAITKENNPANFGIDLFSRLGIGMRGYGRKVECCHLPMQYRFSSEIMHIPNFMGFYPKGYKLIHDSENDKRIISEARQTKLFNGKTTAIIDTSLVSPESQRIRHSVLCPYNAFLDLHIVEKLMVEGFKPEEIAIITPYRVQAEFLTALKKNTKMKDVICSTVHRLQGDERKVIIYDISNSKGSGVVGIRSTPRNIRYEFPPIDQDRKFNVAITRTQCHFVFVGNINYLMEHGSSNQDEYEDSIYRRYIEAVRNSGIPICEIDAASLIEPEGVEEIRKYTKRRSIPEDPPSVSEGTLNRYKAKIIDAEKYDFKFTHIMYENDFYCFLKLDLGRTTKRLIIVSPFLSRRRIRWYENALQRLREEQIEIIVYTKPREELLSDMHNDSISHLQGMGIQIKYLKGIHSKFIGIDNDVCYTGSLNPLSHCCTLETMIRFKGSGCVDAFLEQIIRSSSPHRGDDTEMKGWLTEKELRKAILELRGRIIGEKGGQPQFILPSSKVDELIKVMPASREKFLNHEAIRDNNFKSYFEDYIDDFVNIFKMRIRGMEEEKKIEQEKELEKREKEREKEREKKKREREKSKNKSKKKKL